MQYPFSLLGHTVIRFMSTDWNIKWKISNLLPTIEPLLKLLDDEFDESPAFVLDTTMFRIWVPRTEGLEESYCETRATGVAGG
ncbi:MAG: hypothetical protein WCY86_04795 [Spirosomataceae bacterium]